MTTILSDSLSSPPREEERGRMMSFLCADLHHACNLRAALPATESAALFARFYGLAVAAAEELRGEVLKLTPDGLIAAFPVAEDAVQAAIVIQAARRR